MPPPTLNCRTMAAATCRRSCPARKPVRIGEQIALQRLRLRIDVGDQFGEPSAADPETLDAFRYRPVQRALQRQKWSLPPVPLPQPYKRRRVRCGRTPQSAAPDGRNDTPLPSICPCAPSAKGQMRTGFELLPPIRAVGRYELSRSPVQSRQRSRLDGPNGVKIIHPAAAAASTARRKSARKNPAAPSPLFFRFPRVRRDAMYAKTSFLKIRRGLAHRGFCFLFDCTGRQVDGWRLGTGRTIR